MWYNVGKQIGKGWGLMEREEKILRKVEEAEHALWDALILLKKNKNKYKEYFEGAENAWVELTLVVERMREEYRLGKEVSKKCT